MNIDELGRTLRDMYENAPHGEKTTGIHLFGVKYANQIATGGLTGAEVIRASGIKPSYLTELHKGIRLAKYVTPKAGV